METVLNIETLNDLRRRLLQSNSKMKNGFDRALINLGVHQENQEGQDKK